MVIKRLEMRWRFVVGVGYRIQGLLRYILLMVIHEVDGKWVIEEFWESFCVLEIHIIKKLHILENYFNSFWFVIIS